MKDGYDGFVEEQRKGVREECANTGVNPDKDCEPIIQSVPNSCDKYMCGATSDPNPPKPDPNPPKPDPNPPKPDPNPPKPVQNTPKPDQITPKPVQNTPKPDPNTAKPDPNPAKPNPGGMAHGIHISLALIVVTFVTIFVFF